MSTMALPGAVPLARPRPADALRRARTGLAITAATLGASAANYGSNLLLARELSPAAFAETAAVIGGVLMLSACSMWFQLATARRVAAGHAPGRMPRVALGVGLLLGALLLLASPALTSVLHLHSPAPLVWSVPAMPALLVLGAMRGALQGAQRFGALAATLGLEAAVRVGATAVLLAAGAGAVTAAVGICAAATAAAGFGALLVLRPGPAGAVPHALDGLHGRPAIALPPAGAAIGSLFVGQAVLANADVLLVSARVPGEAARYAAAAMIGRLVAVVCAALAGLAVPRLVRAASTAERTTVLRESQRTVALIGGALTAAAAVLAPLVMGPLLGSALRSGAPLIAPYAAATVLAAVATLQATGDAVVGAWRGPTAVTVAAVVQSAFIAALATRGVVWVTWIQVVCMVGLLAAQRGRTPQVRSIVRPKVWSRVALSPK